jgi:RNA polymerase sigma factor (sigma-70 family)
MKSLLNQYLDLKAEQEQLEQEIKEFYDTCINTAILSHGSRGGGISDPTAAFADAAAKLHVKLLYKKYEAMSALEAIEDMIEGLEPRERRLMREYYINGLKWEEVAVKMNYSIQRVWQIHGDALRKIRDN